MTELVRRLERDVDRKKLTRIIEPLGLTLDEPGPPPDTDEMVERYDTPCDVGSFVLEGRLELLGFSVPLHFRVNYAGRITSDDPMDVLFGGPSITLDLLTWTEDKPSVPEWVPVGPGIFSNAMVERVWGEVALHALDQAYAPENDT
ncbi:hypothetical protein [Novosphingobium album (ex Hu et al. 2023)]|nr:hypothetical protein [Novosphingobium album (ex Hu et al. 2023)]